MARDERRTMQAVAVAVSRYRTTQSSGASEARPPFGRDAVSMYLANANDDVYARFESTDQITWRWRAE
ncbi:hypothetical protein E4U37_000825 [Claviceps purpurea]|nr:hypothetical protein E4U37_000825 [Claviceps purpurea]